MTRPICAISIIWQSITQRSVDSSIVCWLSPTYSCDNEQVFIKYQCCHSRHMPYGCGHAKGFKKKSALQDYAISLLIRYWLRYGRVNCDYASQHQYNTGEILQWRWSFSGGCWSSNASSYSVTLARRRSRMPAYTYSMAGSPVYRSYTSDIISKQLWYSLIFLARHRQYTVGGA